MRRAPSSARPSARPGAVLPAVRYPMEADYLPVPAEVGVEHRAGVRVWPWWGPRTASFDPNRAEDFLVWRSAPVRAPRSRDRRVALFGRYGRSQGRVDLAKPTSALLSAFVSLADARPEAVARFARRWGVLGICRHGQPCSHAAFTSRRQLTPDAPGRCVPLGWDGHGGIEPVAAWQAYSKLAGVILGIAEKLRGGEAPTPEEWRMLLGSRAPAPHTPRRAGRMVWPALVAAVNRWLVDGDARPQLILDLGRGLQPPESRVRLTAPWWMGNPSWPLFAALGVSLAEAVVGGIFTACSACGGMYRPSRPPRVGQQHYCRECGRPAANREAQRRWRDRQRRAARSRRPRRS
jgi:hypothetical protein